MGQAEKVGSGRQDGSIHINTDSVLGDETGMVLGNETDLVLILSHSFILIEFEFHIILHNLGGAPFHSLGFNENSHRNGQGLAHKPSKTPLLARALGHTWPWGYASLWK